MTPRNLWRNLRWVLNNDYNTDEPVGCGTILAVIEVLAVFIYLVVR